LRFRRLIRNEPVEQLQWIVDVEFEHNRPQRGLFRRRDRGDDADVRGLPVEQYPHVRSLDALEKQPSGGITYVSVPELVVNLLEAAQPRRFQEDGIGPSLELVGGVP
jgi:hypothetical protein